MRKKWKEKVEFIERSVPDVGGRKKIVMFNGENGDLYLSVCPENHRMGQTIRIERSGGASTVNPRLVQALTLAYDALANNPDLLEAKNTTFSEIEDEGIIFLSCTSCHFKVKKLEDRTLEDLEVNFCPKCGKKIVGELHE